MHSDYKREMEQIAPSAAAMERLEAAMQNSVPRRRVTPLRFGRNMVLAAVVCGVLALSTVAAGPTVWQMIQNQLGVRAPLAVPAEGSVTDQDIEVRLVGSLSDSYEATVYFTASDLTVGRFNEYVRVSAELQGELEGDGSVQGCEVLSYDEETDQILVEVSLLGVDASAPLTLEVSGFNSSGRSMQVELPRPEKLQRVSTTTVNGTTVLLPGENPQEIAEGVFLSAMGFDDDGLFHIRLDFGEGYGLGRYLFIVPQNQLYPDQNLYQENSICTELEHGVDLAYPRLTQVSWEQISGFYVDGGYSGPGAVVQGTWELPVTLEQVEQQTIVVDQTVDKFHVEQVEVSQMGVVVTYQRLYVQSGWLTNVQLFDRNGNQVPLTTDMCVTKDIQKDLVYTRFILEEPVELENLDHLVVGGLTIPLH